MSFAFLKLVMTLPFSVGAVLFLLMNWPLVFRVKPDSSGVWSLARQIEFVLVHFLYACGIGFFSSMYMSLEALGVIWWVSLMLILWSMKSKLALNESKRPSFAWSSPAKE